MIYRLKFNYQRKNRKLRQKRNVEQDAYSTFLFCQYSLTGPDNAIDYIGPQDYTVTRHDKTARYWTAPNLYKRKRDSMLPLPDLTASHHTLPLQDNAKLHRYVNERNCIKLYLYCSEPDSSWLHHYDTRWLPTKQYHYDTGSHSTIPPRSRYDGISYHTFTVYDGTKLRTI